MSLSKVVQIGGCAALAGSLFIWTFMYQAPVAAAAPDDAGRGWDARVSGTGTDGLQVRQGPGVEFPSMANIAEGGRIHVAEGPRFDRDGHPWYRVTGFNRAGSSGWSVGDFLVGSPPAPVDAAAPTPTPGSSSGGSVAGVQTFNSLITAYTYQTPGNGAHGSITKSGTTAHWGTVAVDPRVIPLGTRLMIEGFDDVFVAEDTGGGVQGDHVEIFFLDTASAMQFGVQRRAVTVLPALSTTR